MPIGSPVTSRKTLLFLIQKFCARTNLSIPVAAMGSTDPQVQQLVGLVEEEGDDLSARHAWQSITFEAAWTAEPAESQGPLDNLAPNGFRFIKNQTIWNRTTRLPIYGPLDATDWQAQKAMAPTGPRYRFRIRGDMLLLNPIPASGDSLFFEYVSVNWIQAAGGGPTINYFANDNDTLLLPEKLMLMGLRWRWKKEKGFEYAEDFRTYEMQIKDAMGRDGAKPIMSMDHDGWKMEPGIFVSPGSWPL